VSTKLTTEVVFSYILRGSYRLRIKVGNATYDRWLQHDTGH
jgi:hypothetical protein